MQMNAIVAARMVVGFLISMEVLCESFVSGDFVVRSIVTYEFEAQRRERFCPNQFGVTLRVLIQWVLQI